MTTKQLDKIRQVCRSTGMFCLHHDVSELAAWISGFGVGVQETTGIDPYAGFNEWFSKRMGWAKNIWWLAVAEQFADQDPRQATLSILALIEECVSDNSK